MSTKTFTKYLSITKRGHVWTESEIIYFRKAVNGSSSLESHQIQDLLTSIEGKSYRITGEQTVKGILWLKNQCFKNNGGVRKSCPFKPFERAVVQSFKEFRFVGLYNISDNAYQNYMPIYRVIATNGMYFDYVAYSFGEMKVLTIGNRKTKFETWCNQPDFEIERLGA